MLKPLQYGCSSDNEMPRSPRMNRINEGPRVGLFLFGVSGCPALALPSAVMTQPQPRNRLHGITLERLLLELVEHMGWGGYARRSPDPLLHPRPQYRLQPEVPAANAVGQGKTQDINTSALIMQEVACKASRS